MSSQPTDVIPVHHDEQATDLAETEARYLGYTARLGQVLRTIAASPMTRYAAYTSDVGEGFRPVVPPAFVTLCYGISWAYVLGDTANETHKRYQETGNDTMEAVRHGSQRLVFNALASMLLPMFTIHTIVHQSQNFLAKRASLSPVVKKWTPVVAGLAIVPALPFMFDHPVEIACERAWDAVWPSKYGHAHRSADTVQHLGAEIDFDTNKSV